MTACVFLCMTATDFLGIMTATVFGVTGPLLRSKKHNAHWRGTRGRFGFAGEFSVGCVARENGQVVRILIGYQHPALGRIKGKVARSLSAGTRPLDRRKRPGLWVCREAENEITAAIGEVDVAAVFGDNGVAACVSLGTCVCGKKFDAAHEGQASIGFVPLEHVDGRVHFVHA